MKTLRSALWWTGIAWVFATVLVLGKIFLAPDFGISTPLSDPTIYNVSLAMLFSSCGVLFFILPQIEPLGLLLLGLVAVWRAFWRRASGR